MILKIRGTNQDWWVFEPYKVHYETITWKQFREHTFPERTTHHPWDLLIISSEEIVGTTVSEGRSQADRDRDQIVIIHIGFGPVQEYSIAMDTVAYLCNETGKTVERIVP